MIRINLLPRERARRGPVFSRAFLVLGIVALVAVMAAYYLYLGSVAAGLQKDITATKDELDKVRPQALQVEALKRRIEGARRKAELLKSLEASRVPWDTVLEEFRAIMPQDVWVTAMSAADDGALTFDGFGMSYEAVARMMVSLDASKVFKETDLEVAQKQAITAGRDAVSFRLTGRLRQERKEAGTR